MVDVPGDIGSSARVIGCHWRAVQAASQPAQSDDCSTIGYGSKQWRGPGKRPQRKCQMFVSVIRKEANRFLMRFLSRPLGVHMYI